MSESAWVSLFANCASILIAVSILWKVITHGQRQKRMMRKLDGRLQKLVRVQAGRAKAEGKLEMLEHPPAGLAVVPSAPAAPPIPAAPPERKE
jgi:hypothetical protein